MARRVPPGDADPGRRDAVTETADIIVVGAGVQGASLAFHLAKRGPRVVILERGVVAGGATGRSSGFVRMHYDYPPDALLSWRSFPYFQHWLDFVGHGDPSFVRTGFVQVVPPRLEPALRANVAMMRSLGIDTRLADREELERLVPGIAAEDVEVVAYEPESGYADPTGTAAGFVAAARAHGARLVQGAAVDRVTTDGDRVTGVATSLGTFAAPVVVDAAGAWAPALAATVGLVVPVQPWRHDTAYFGLPQGRSADLPIVLDNARQVYFRPEGHDLLLVGLESGSEVGGSPDRPLASVGQDSIDTMATRVVARLPWMAGGTVRTAHGGQDGVTPDERPILGPAGPDGFFLACGFSGTGFKTAPAIGASLAEWILDGRPSAVDISGYDPARFAEGRPIRGDHSYGALWE
jgi:sarcosine oxidase subunit beta